MKSISHMRLKNYGSTWEPLIKHISLLLDEKIYLLMLRALEMEVRKTVEDPIPDVIWQDLRSEMGVIE